jgi:hypothetical protein
MYVLFRHNNALLAIMQAPLVPEPEGHMESSRQLAISTLKRIGWSWPTLLDEPYPEVVPDETGAKYERTTVRYVSSCLLL